MRSARNTSHDERLGGSQCFCLAFQTECRYIHCMTTFYRIYIGTLTLTESREVSIPQSYAAYHETVRVEPGTYPVYAYIVPRFGCEPARVHSISAHAEGITASCYYGPGTQDRVGKPSKAHIELPTYGVVSDKPGILAQAKLSDDLVRKEWDPRNNDSQSTTGRMWRLEVRPGLEVRGTGDEPYYKSTRQGVFVQVEEAA